MDTHKIVDLNLASLNLFQGGTNKTSHHITSHNRGPVRNGPITKRPPFQELQGMDQLHKFNWIRQLHQLT
jgi:hypothetical protein